MINGRKIISVITARAGSQRLKGKNYKEICGKSLFMWSVDASLSSDYVDHTLISSNCDEIKDKAHQSYGSDSVLFVDRPDDISTSNSKNEAALIHAIEFLESKYNLCLNDNYLILNLQPTSPIRIKSLIDDCILSLDETGLDSLLTVSPHTPFFLQVNDGKIQFHFDRLDRKMGQDFTKEDMYYHDDGCLYLMTFKQLYSSMCRLSDNPYLFINDKYSSFQIDDESDFIIADGIMREIRTTGRYI
jgi:CMP-N-acetylneuraminic acid synthetase